MNASNPDHQRLAALLESSTGMPHRPIFERKYEALFAALRQARFEIVEDEDLAEQEHTRSNAARALAPWFAPLEAVFSNPSTIWASEDNGSCGEFGRLTKNAAVTIVQAGKHQVSLLGSRKRCADL